MSWIKMHFLREETFYLPWPVAQIPSGLYDNISYRGDVFEVCRLETEHKLGGNFTNCF